MPLNIMHHASQANCITGQRTVNDGNGGTCAHFSSMALGEVSALDSTSQLWCASVEVETTHMRTAKENAQKKR